MTRARTTAFFLIVAACLLTTGCPRKTRTSAAESTEAGESPAKTPALHKWESLSTPAVLSIYPMIGRMRVPGGWVYMARGGDSDHPPSMLFVADVAPVDSRD